MCGRYTLRDPRKAAAAYLSRSPRDLPPPRYNVSPGLPAPVIRPSSETGEAEWVALFWGLAASWKGKESASATGLVNARSETVAEKPTFQRAYRFRRCIVPVDGFYEWKRRGNERQPYFFHNRDDEPFAIAGIWDNQPRPDSPEFSGFCLLTTEADSLMAPIHHRMPLILRPGLLDLWLDPNCNDPKQLEACLRPFSPGTMEVYPVDPWVNKAENEGPRCIERWRGPEQGELPL